MKTKKTQTSSLNHETDFIQKGDIAILLKTDGDVQIVSFGIDQQRLLDNGPSSDEDEATVTVAEKAFALAFAATHPGIMQTLLNIVKDPDVCDVEAILKKSLN